MKSFGNKVWISYFVILEALCCSFQTLRAAGYLRVHLKGQNFHLLFSSYKEDSANMLQEHNQIKPYTELKIISSNKSLSPWGSMTGRKHSFISLLTWDRQQLVSAFLISYILQSFSPDLIKVHVKPSTFVALRDPSKWWRYAHNWEKKTKTPLPWL